MFTGIIETVGRVVRIEPEGALTRFRIEAPAAIPGVRLGDSIAINGACLTVTHIEGDTLCFDAIQETLDLTSLGGLVVDAKVNVERAMRADGRLDGHIVQGHVDATGTVRMLERKGDDVRLFIACGEEITSILVPKGSVAIDGVSLTVVGVAEDGFDVALIPHTLAETNLGEREPGDRVNLEADVLGKYVLRYLERLLPYTTRDRELS